jgi:hypothetical protein
MKTRNSQLDLQSQHLAAGLDPADIKYLDTPPPSRKPTTYNGIAID